MKGIPSTHKDPFIWLQHSDLKGRYKQSLFWPFTYLL